MESFTLYPIGSVRLDFYFDMLNVLLFKKGNYEYLKLTSFRFWNITLLNDALRVIEEKFSVVIFLQLTTTVHPSVFGTCFIQSYFENRDFTYWSSLLKDLCFQLAINDPHCITSCTDWCLLSP